MISVGLDAAIGDFCAGLENLCGRAEMNDDDREESEWLPLPLADIRVLVNDIVSIRAKNFLHLVPVDILVRTLRVLDHQIHRAEGLSINDCEHVSLRFCIHILLVVDMHCTQGLRYIDWILCALLPYKLYICVYAINSVSTTMIQNVKCITQFSAICVHVCGSLLLVAVIKVSTFASFFDEQYKLVSELM